MYKGLCVNVDPNTGVCAGTNGMIANNDKGVCDGEDYFSISKDLINFSSLRGQLH